MGTRNVIFRAEICVGGLLLVATSSSATIPPPIPSKFVESWKAIEALGPLMGEWHGTEIQHVRGAGDFPQLVFWRLTRPGNQDVILLEHGHESKTPLSGRESDKPATDQINIVTFSPIDKHYKIFVAGYRLFRDSDSTGQLLEVAQPQADAIQWVTAQDDGGSRKTTLKFHEEKLVEAVDEVSPAGVARRVIDAEFSK